jgi:hypothetical protein
MGDVSPAEDAGGAAGSAEPAASALFTGAPQFGQNLLSVFRGEPQFSQKLAIVITSPVYYYLKYLKIEKLRKHI